MTHTPPPAPHEAARWRCHTRLEKRRVVNPDTGIPLPAPVLYDAIETDGNLLMYGGASALWDLLIGAGNVTDFSNSNAHIGVGNSSTAAAATQTDLQGASKHREAVDGSYPSHTDGTTSGAATVTFKATFETGDANFAWEEWGVFNAASSGRMLNRKVQSFGTKTSSDEWALTVTITIA